LPFGIVSIVYAAQVNGYVAAGNQAGALGASAKARTWAWIAFGSGIVIIGGWVFLSFVGVLPGA
jgi:hypothetical protein